MHERAREVSRAPGHRDHLRTLAPNRLQQRHLHLFPGLRRAQQLGHGRLQHLARPALRRRRARRPLHRLERGRCHRQRAQPRRDLHPDHRRQTVLAHRGRLRDQGLRAPEQPQAAQPRRHQRRPGARYAPARHQRRPPRAVQRAHGRDLRQGRLPLRRPGRRPRGFELESLHPRADLLQLHHRRHPRHRGHHQRPQHRRPGPVRQVPLPLPGRGATPTSSSTAPPPTTSRSSTTARPPSPAPM